MAENPPVTAPPIEVPPAQAGAAASIGNPRDIQGIIGIVVVGGTLAIAAAAIATGASALQVLSTILPLTGTIIGFYFGQKSQTG